MEFYAVNKLGAVMSYYKPTNLSIVRVCYVLIGGIGKESHCPNKL